MVAAFQTRIGSATEPVSPILRATNDGGDQII